MFRYPRLFHVGTPPALIKKSTLRLGGEVGKYPRGVVVLYKYDENHQPPEPTGIMPVLIVSGRKYGNEFPNCRLGIPLYPPEADFDPETEFIVNPSDIIAANSTHPICLQISENAHTAPFYGLNVINVSDILGVCGYLKSGVLEELVRGVYAGNLMDVPEAVDTGDLFNHGQLFTAYFRGLGSRALERAEGPRPFECRVGGEKRRPAICLTSWVDRDNPDAPGLISCIPLSANPHQLTSGTEAWVQDYTA